MNVIIEFISTIGRGLLTMIDFLVSMVRDLVSAVGLLLELLPALPALFSWLPGGIAVTLGATLGVAVVYKIIGWDG